MASDYVAPGPGGFVVVVGGKQIGSFPDQASAEQAYNDATGQSNGPAASTGGGQVYQTPNGPKTLAEMQAGLQGAGWNGDYNDPAAVIAAYNNTASGSGAGATGGAASASQKLLDAIASGDQAKFDEAVREFDQNFDENQRQFDTTLAEKSREFDTSNYTNLGTTLLNTAANLRGPKDYYQFQQFTSGGRDLMSQLYGNQPRPDFSAPSGTIEPETVSDLMAKLGFTTSPISGVANAVGAQPPTANTPTPGMYTTVNGSRTVDQMYQELHGIGWGGDATDTNAIVAAYAATTKNPVTPQASTPTTPGAPAPTTATQPGMMHTQAATAPPPGTVTHAPSIAAPTGQPQAATGFGTPKTVVSQGNGGDAGGTQTAIPPGGTSFNPSPVPQTPLPYQINPAVWDSLGPVGQQLTLSAAAANGWDTDEFLRQLNMSRPQGTAPKATTTSYSAPMGSFA